MKPRTLVLTVAVTAIAVTPGARAQSQADQPFVAGGTIDIHLDRGDYEIRAAPDDHVRLTLTGSTGKAAVNVATNGNHAVVTVKNTPRNFRCVIEVPKVSDILLRLSAGDLDIAEIIGNKDIESKAGDMKIAAGDPGEYASVHASAKAGDVSPGPFAPPSPKKRGISGAASVVLGSPKGGFIGRSVNWTGQGKYKLHARVGAGDLQLR
jgi:hypothetical protein